MKKTTLVVVNSKSHPNNDLLLLHCFELLQSSLYSRRPRILKLLDEITAFLWHIDYGNVCSITFFLFL